jgi:uncharacterized protein (DUF697 family)
MSERIDSANGIIRRYSYWSAGLGLIPIPIVDVAAITGTQVKMIADLAKLYEREFAADRTKSIISALVGGLAPVAVGTGAASAMKFVPIFGQIAAVLLVPALAGATTIALGKVFVQHFEAGGTLLDFDPQKMRAYFQAEFEAARTKDEPIDEKPAKTAAAKA